jgi:glycosyltransferase involved in cell wall biosynthesis
VREILSPSCPVVAVPPGVSSLTVPRDAEHLRSAVGAPSTGYALFVGTAEPRKGLDVLLDAFATGRLDTAPLVVVGPRGWGGVDIAREGERRALGRRLVVTGRVDDETLAALYAGASVVVQPSRAEGFGLPVLEAMSMGVPVVVSDDPALREVGGDAVLPTPIGRPEALSDAIARVVENPDVARRMREAGRSRAAQFSWATTAERLWRAYQNC